MLTGLEADEGCPVPVKDAIYPFLTVRSKPCVGNHLDQRKEDRSVSIHWPCSPKATWGRGASYLPMSDSQASLLDVPSALTISGSSLHVLSRLSSTPNETCLRGF